MASLDFSKAVVEGMKRHGCSDTHILKITGLSRSALKEVLASKGRLSNTHLDRIEEATGRTVGQLAALTLPQGARRLTYIFDELAKSRSQSLKKKRAG